MIFPCSKGGCRGSAVLCCVIYVRVACGWGCVHAQITICELMHCPPLRCDLM
jgi:hypothetical protein